jgi:hypothetical protein
MFAVEISQAVGRIADDDIAVDEQRNFGARIEGGGFGDMIGRDDLEGEALIFHRHAHLAAERAQRRIAELHHDGLRIFVAGREVCSVC